MTIIEVVIASAMVLLMTLSMLEGLMFCRRMVAENSARLTADALAWDLLWKTFNMDYDALKFKALSPEELKLLAPGLQNPLIVTEIKTETPDGGSLNGKKLTINVLWKCNGKERGLAPKLDDSTYTLFRSNSSRELMGN
ncbi:MAG: hypothetical protein RR133_06590 [Kiritimatiellia bacterium]